MTPKVTPMFQNIAAVISVPAPLVSTVPQRRAISQMEAPRPACMAQP